MNGEKILRDTFDDMMVINPSDKTIMLYQSTMKAFQHFEVLDCFYQIKKDDDGDGLAWEIMFFNKSEVVDIVVSRNSLDSTTILTKNIIAVNLQLKYAKNYNEKNELIHVDSMTLSIVNASDSNSLYYTTDTSKHSDFIRLRDNLLKMTRA